MKYGEGNGRHVVSVMIIGLNSEMIVKEQEVLYCTVGLYERDLAGSYIWVFRYLKDGASTQLFAIRL